jgi:hypothetical protein
MVNRRSSAEHSRRAWHWPVEDAGAHKGVKDWLGIGLDDQKSVVRWWPTGAFHMPHGFSCAHTLALRMAHDTLTLDLLCHTKGGKHTENTMIWTTKMLTSFTATSPAPTNILIARSDPNRATFLLRIGGRLITYDAVPQDASLPVLSVHLTLSSWHGPIWVDKSLINPFGTASWAASRAASQL